MKRFVVEVVLVFACATSHSFSQAPDPLTFFPHHQGDIWEYNSPQDTSYYEQNLITSNTLGPDGRYHIQTTRFGRNILDTSDFRVYRIYNGTDTLLQYELAADSGDSWVVFRFGPGVTRMAVVVSVYQTFLFGGIPVTIKEIDYVDSASGLQTYTDFLASDFGLVGLDFDTFPYLRVRGARINGVQHGTITSVAEDPPHLLATSARLHQNYPNPFNPTTTIRYALPKDAFVTLRIYNLLGQEVSLLRDEMQTVGFHDIVWNGRNMNGQSVASGVYFYRLEARPLDGAEPFTSFKKMLMLK